MDSVHKNNYAEEFLSLELEHTLVKLIFPYQVSCAVWSVLSSRIPESMLKTVETQQGGAGQYCAA